MFNPEKFIEDAVNDLKKSIGEKHAIIALSGGVDSSVAAVLTHRAVGSNLISIFVDTGFMRKSEPEHVRQIFEDQFRQYHSQWIQNPKGSVIAYAGEGVQPPKSVYMSFSIDGMTDGADTLVLNSVNWLLNT